MNEQRNKVNREMRIGITVAIIAVLLLSTILIVRNATTVRKPTSSSLTTTSHVTSTGTTTSTSQTPSSDSQVGDLIEEELERPFRVPANVYRYFYEEGVDEDLLTYVLLPDKGIVQSTGVDYVYNNEEFPVYAAFSGTIRKLETDVMKGNIIHIESEDNLIAVYQSITFDPSLQEGMVVSQGSLIGKAAQATERPDSNTHLHFALMRGDKLFNPETNFGSIITEII